LFYNINVWSTLKTKYAGLMELADISDFFPYLLQDKAFDA